MVGLSSDTLFWLDNWTGNGEFAYRFPLLFELDKNKFCLVSERCNPNNMDWAWKKLPSSPLEISELESLKEIVESYSFSDGSDSWNSKLSADESFYVHDCRTLIDSKVTTLMYNPTKWIRLVLLKVMMSVWRACIDRIPSAVMLSRMGISLPSTSCQFCVLEIDEADHFLVWCPFAKYVSVGSLTGATCPFSNSIQLEGSSCIRNLGGIALKT